MKKDALGQLEQLVLMAVLALGEDAYGAAVHEKTLELAERPISFGSVYMTLDRLEDKGYLASRPGTPPPEGGNNRRFFRMRATGKQALRDALATSKRLQQTAEALDFT